MQIIRFKAMATAVMIIAPLVVWACTPSDQMIQTSIANTQAAWTLVPTQTPYPMATVWIQTKIVFVTPQPTMTPKFTPTASNTPKPTQDPFTRTRGDGFYLVGIDIAPGVWRSTGNGDSCYWEVSERNGEIIDNDFGLAGGTAYIPPGAFQVEFKQCGTWIYLGP